MKAFDVPMISNDPNVTTVGEYMMALAKVVWEHDQVKRPFGNSDWKEEVYGSLCRAGLIDGEVVYQDEDYIEYDYDYRDGNKILMEAFAEALDPAKRADHAVDVTEDALIVRHPPLCDRPNCLISDAAKRTPLPVPLNGGRYPIYVDHATGEIRIVE